MRGCVVTLRQWKSWAWSLGVFLHVHNTGALYWNQRQLVKGCRWMLRSVADLSHYPTEDHPNLKAYNSETSRKSIHLLRSNCWKFFNFVLNVPCSLWEFGKHTRRFSGRLCLCVNNKRQAAAGVSWGCW